MTGPTGSSDDDDPAALARRFLDLWQEEIAGSGREGGPGPLALRLAALHLAALAGVVAGSGLNGPAGAAAPGSAAAPAASGDGGDRLAELARRLAACEERIAALAARGAGADEGPRSSPRGRRS